MTTILKTTIALFFVFTTVIATSVQAIETSAQISARNAQQYTEQFMVGGQPSEADLAILAKNGYKTVINLRGNGEFTGFNEKAKVEALGMKYVSIPMAGAAGVTQENLELFSAAIANQQQAFVHCASGNRVGAMFALDAHFNHNASVEEAVAIGKKSGLTRLEGKIRKMMAKK
jgi:uncharacterized protein (TIGR01244 family)